MTRMDATLSWQHQAEKKRTETLSKIPSEWLLDDHVKREANLRRNLTSQFIESLLLPDEQKIMALDGTFEGAKGTGKEINVNSQMVEDLLSLGAVLYCKTSVPQTLLIEETHNNIIAYWKSAREKTGTGYTTINNLLDYSCVCIPITHADENIDTFHRNYKPLNEDDRLNWEAYDPGRYDGAPVGVQIVGRGLQEEWILSIAELVYDAL
ncbi:hypothetical protein G7Y89_g5786 [Cudoniella acicularis]|uniref:Amidase domain-containing protein n=1 Tax=Cudoniella acicularis TaxID=354080 RepID=A0A8H4W5E5_9HELO|nr:hypothetical protein G7Y89_g5786 [Cudoniella acicularis]